MDPIKLVGHCTYNMTGWPTHNWDPPSPIKSKTFESYLKLARQ